MLPKIGGGKRKRQLRVRPLSPSIARKRKSGGAGMNLGGWKTEMKRREDSRKRGTYRYSIRHKQNTLVHRGERLRRTHMRNTHAQFCVFSRIGHSGHTYMCTTKKQNAAAKQT